MTNPTSAWTRYQQLERDHGIAFVRVLYGWFVAECDTLGDAQAGSLHLRQAPEALALAVMTEAEVHLARAAHGHPDDWLDFIAREGRSPRGEQYRRESAARRATREQAAPAADGAAIDIYTDGACSGNPGPGGWGALVRQPDGHESELYGGERQTTNNRMELQAVISALSMLDPGASVRITTDSQYVMKGITEWIYNWKRNNWRTSGKDPVKNEDLWRQLDAQVARHQVHWQWVRGHNGHVDNERADALARRGIDSLGITNQEMTTCNAPRPQ